MKIPFLARLGLAGSLLLASGLSSASVMLDGTRVVLAAPAKEASMVARNRAAADMMIQSWVESGDEQGDVPFAITPALSRLGAEKQQVLRILYHGQGLPTDRESVFWLNVQEIPQKTKAENVLQIAIRQRIKLFYRPAGLPGKVQEAPAQLAWHVVNQGGKPMLEVRNPTPYHVSLGTVTLRSGGQDYEVAPEMVPPLVTRQLAFKDQPGRVAADAKVHFEYINDYGGTVRQESAVSG